MIHEQPEAARQGFTLIETTIALMILGFGLLAMAAMQLQAIDYATRGRHQTEAAVIAQRRIEVLQRLPWASISPTSWTTPVTVNHFVNDGIQQIEQSYAVSWRIADLAAGITRSIDVRVNWNDPNRANREYALSSVRFNF